MTKCYKINYLSNRGDSYYIGCEVDGKYKDFKVSEYFWSKASINDIAAISHSGLDYYVKKLISFPLKKDKKVGNLKWSHFEDKKGNKYKTSIINGKYYSKHLTDTYFELDIKDGFLNIQLEEERGFFYKNKRDLIYRTFYDKIKEISNQGYYDFYNEKSNNPCKIVRRVYSKVEN